mmetsp:Transcript_37261/g.42551  ORF Transcript_37261/g.42551 Transcript_37261/m.42551 type:complete len:1095 (-) Transcript_37261:71-3355(-)
MFDGNHRVRKDINLSGNRRRRAAPIRSFLTGVEDRRATILEHSRRQREIRKLEQQKIKSATFIQKVVRGWLKRSYLIKKLRNESRLCKLITSVELSMFISMTKNYRELLLTYAKQRPSEVKGSFSNLSKQRILQSALKELYQTAEQQILLELIQHMMGQNQNQLSNETCLELFKACQRWLDDVRNEEVMKKLWEWSCQAATTLQSKTKAYLAITLLGYSERKELQSTAAAYFGANDSNHWTYHILLKTLVEEIEIGDKTVMSMLKDRESKILYRSLKLYESLCFSHQKPNARVIISLIKAVLSKSQEATILAILQISGEKVRKIVLEGGPDEVKQSVVEENDSDIDKEEVEQASSSDPNRTNHHHRITTTFRLTRQQIQTIPRLNQLYQDNLWKISKDILSCLERKSMTYKINMVELTEYLGNAKLWQQWLEVDTKDYENLRLFGCLLQGCSGFKTSVRSPFLSHLAYSRPFVEGLWKQTLIILDKNLEEELTLYAIIVFCDIFSHHLIALNDKDFLQYYTQKNSNPVILVENVVDRLKSFLYDLYWNEPVVATDMYAEEGIINLRARMLLSGTKLWNSLYERWSRLVLQSPFCDESSWWFPRLVSRDDDGAVIGSRSNNGDMEYNDVDVMEEDSSESDEEQLNEREVENDALADNFRDPKMARLLTSIPQAIPFDRRVKLFNSLLNADKRKTQDESMEFRRAVSRMMERGDDVDMTDFSSRERVEIRRDAMYLDSLTQLNKLGSRLKSKVQVTMINKHGAYEAGIDGGGVFKEFLDDLISEAFLGKRDGSTPRLFSVTPLQTLAINMDTTNKEDILPHYGFLGRVLGKAIYESILVEPQFCLPFLNQLLGKLNSLEDLKNFDFEFYNNLTKLRTMSEKEIEGIGLSFELNVGTSRTVPLIPGGSSTLVTKNNVIQYVYLVANQHLNIEGSKQIRAFLRGFRDLIPASWVRLFSAHELQKMISGDDSVMGIDVPKLKETMKYSGGYHASQPIIQWFWEVIEEISPDQQRKFLRFVTSCSRQPLLGFQALEPAPCIQQIRLPDAVLSSRDAMKRVPLPTSSTCMNLLKLPNYKNKTLLQKKLLDAIQSGSGFELT